MLSGGATWQSFWEWLLCSSPRQGPLGMEVSERPPPHLPSGWGDRWEETLTGASLSQCLPDE